MGDMGIRVLGGARFQETLLLGEVPATLLPAEFERMSNATRVWLIDNLQHSTVGGLTHG